MSTNSRFIKTSPEAVFAIFRDGWLFPSWVVGASRIRGVDESWPAPQSKLYHSVGVWPLVIDDTTSVVEWDPPRRVRFLARGWPVGEAEVTFDVKRRGSGCLVRMREDAVRGPGRFVPKPVRDIGLLIRNKEALQRLAWLAEKNHL
jgi:hypothetical protein